MGDETDHSVFERLAVLETKVAALFAFQAKIEKSDEDAEKAAAQEKEESLLSSKIGGVELKLWLLIIGAFSALGQLPDLLKIIQTLAQVGFVK